MNKEQLISISPCFGDENFANLDGADAVESTERFDSFADEITRLPDGRYCTPIPWKTDK